LLPEGFLKACSSNTARHCFFHYQPLPRSAESTAPSLGLWFCYEPSLGGQKLAQGSRACGTHNAVASAVLGMWSLLARQQGARLPQPQQTAAP